MKKNKQFFALLLILFCIHGCKKDELNSDSFLIKDAKAFYFKYYEKPALIKENVNGTLSIEEGIPDWDKAYIDKVFQNENVVVVPMKFSQQFFEKQSNFSSINLEDAAKLCMRQVSANSFSVEQVVNLPYRNSSLNNPESKSLILKKNLLTHVDSAFILRGNNLSSATVSRSSPNVNMYANCQLWGHYLLYSDGTSELQYTYWVCDDYGSGGGSGGGASDEEIAYRKLDEIASTGNPTSESVSENELSIGTNEKEKEYEWVAFRNLGFAIFSYERGVHELNPTPPNAFTKWRWKSLTHVNMSSVGTVVGGTVSYEDKSGNPSPTLGVYFATIAVRYEVKYSVGWNGSPLSVSYSYRSSSPVYNCNQ